MTLAFLVSLSVSALSGLFVIPLLKRLKLRQSILEIGPKWHSAKQGTPTMGGLMFIIGITAAVFVIGIPDMREGKYGHLFILAFSLIFGIIGMIDDYSKKIKKQNQGLTAIQKLMLQLAASAAFIALLRYFNYLTPGIKIPFTSITINLPFAVYAAFAMLVVAGMVNAVNLTDGVDGLCTGVTIPVAVFFTALGILWGKNELSIFAAALSGGLCGFLIYNFHPAKVFMGDTGSLFLGGAVCGLGFVFDAPLFIIITGGIYVAEMLSVILQVSYFKLTGGKRLFKMAPFHHHLEMKGFSEIKIFILFTSITAVLCLIAYLSAVYY